MNTALKRSLAAALVAGCLAVAPFDATAGAAGAASTAAPKCKVIRTANGVRVSCTSRASRKTPKKKVSPKKKKK
jgi:hypothetical protein